MTEKEKMEAKMWYDASNDEEIVKLRMKAEDLCFEINNIRPSDLEKRTEKLKELFSELNEIQTLMEKTKFSSSAKFNYNAFIFNDKKVFDNIDFNLFNKNEPIISILSNSSYKEIVRDDKSKKFNYDLFNQSQQLAKNYKYSLFWYQKSSVDSLNCLFGHN